MTKESRWDHPCDEDYRNLYLSEKKRLDLEKGLKEAMVGDEKVKDDECSPDDEEKAICNSNSIPADQSTAADESKEWKNIMSNLKRFLVQKFQNSNALAEKHCNNNQPAVFASFIPLVEEVKEIFSTFAQKHFSNLDCKSLVLKDKCNAIPDVSYFCEKNMEIRYVAICFISMAF